MFELPALIKNVFVSEPEPSVWRSHFETVRGHMITPIAIGATQVLSSVASKLRGTQVQNLAERAFVAVTTSIGAAAGHSIYEEGPRFENVAILSGSVVALGMRQVMKRFSQGMSASAPVNVNEEDTDIAERVVKAVFVGVEPHVTGMSLWALAHQPNMQYFAQSLPFVAFAGNVIMDVATVIKTPGFKIGDLKQLLAKYPEKMLWLALASLAVADQSGSLPRTLETRLAIDSLLLLATAYASSKAISRGTDLALSNASTLTERVENVTSGIITAGLGFYGLNNTFENAEKLADGFQIFMTLDPVQQNGVLIFRSMHRLPEPKTCNAVIMTESALMQYSSPIAEVVYGECRTFTYDAHELKWSLDFCNTLKDASSRANGNIDVLVLNGYSKCDVIRLSPDYVFEGLNESSCMRDILSPDAQIILAGSQTASHSGICSTSLTENVAKLVPGRQVIGFDGQFDQTLMTVNYDGKLHPQGYRLENTHGLSVPVSTTVIVQTPPDPTRMQRLVNQILTKIDEFDEAFQNWKASSIPNEGVVQE